MLRCYIWKCDVETASKVWKYNFLQKLVFFMTFLTIKCNVCLLCRSWECASPWHSTATSVEQDWATSYRCSIPPYIFVYALCTTVSSWICYCKMRLSNSKWHCAFTSSFHTTNIKLKMLHEKIRSDFAYSDFFSENLCESRLTLHYCTPVALCTITFKKKKLKYLLYMSKSWNFYKQKQRQIFYLDSTKSFKIWKLCVGNHIW